MKKLNFIFAIMAIGFAVVFTSCEKDNYVPENNEAVVSDSSTHSLKSVYANYYPSAAVNYALQYAFNYNPNYFSWNDANNSDCANFVSQCLYQGGGLYQDATWWYDTRGYSNVNYHSASGAWKRSNELYYYLANSSYNLNNTKFSYLSSRYSSYIEEGDIIFYYGDPDGLGMRYYHVVIVTDKTYNDVLISAHTFNMRNYSMRASFDYAKNNENLSFIRVIHFN